MLMWRSPSFSPSPSSALPCVLWHSRWTCCLRKWLLFNAYVSRLPVCSFTFLPPLHTVPWKDKYALYTHYVYIGCMCSSLKLHVFCLWVKRNAERDTCTRLWGPVRRCRVTRFNVGLVSRVEFVSKACFFIYVFTGGRRGFFFFFQDSYSFFTPCYVFVALCLLLYSLA